MNDLPPIVSNLKKFLTARLDEAEIVQTFMNGRKKIGEIIREDGVLTFMSYRQQRQIFREGFVSLTAAIEQQKCSWSTDAYFLDKARHAGCTIVEVFETDTGARHISAMEDWFDTKKSRSESVRRGTVRHLGWAHFQHIDAPLQMKSKRSRSI